MERTLIPQGKGGYTIYLPKKWIDRKGLKGGDSVNVTEKATALIIGSPVATARETTIEINENSRKNIVNLITHSYRRGFDRIIFINTDSKLNKQIEKIVDEVLMGFEVTEKTSNKCVIENIGEPTETKFDVLMRRNFLLIKEKQNILVRDFEKNKLDSMKEIQDLRNKHDKYVLFCRRTLTKERYIKDPVLGWELLTYLMNIDHAHYYLYKYAYDNKIKKDKDIISLLKDLKEYFNLLYNAYYLRDLKYNHQLHIRSSKYQYGKCFKMLNKGKNAVVYSYLREIFRLTQVATSPILSGILHEKAD
jgi:phosphate uptake regulator